MRLIDADALLESAGLFEAKACARGCGKSILRLAKTWLWNEVNEAPTIDAVPVVRCRDCKYGRWDSEPHDAMVCIRCGLDGWYSGDSFCSYGVRKEGDKDGS